MKHKTNLVWMDLEMTGLDPEKERIIEIATLITDKDLNVIAEGPNLVIHQPARVLRAMDDWNQKHHKKSGLLDAVKASRVSIRQAERETLRFIKGYCFPKKSPLCGNSIHHDRLFLLKSMPRIHDYLHYRIVDVSSLKFLIQSWYPKDKKLKKKKSAHRALEDIQASIDELKHYREHYLVKKD
ncbi:MAG: oligoribonuclease [Candidatus Omnitrophica bacterium]|nr:oligoribonuclease [Candidatus Omnitrophota bacterium]